MTLYDDDYFLFYILSNNMQLSGVFYEFPYLLHFSLELISYASPHPQLTAF